MPTSQILVYYDTNANEFVNSTVDVEFASMQQAF